jgi:arginine repressor
MPEPLEALGAILRRHVTQTQEELVGLNQKKTTRPTADLITRHFNQLMVAKIGHERV